MLRRSLAPRAAIVARISIGPGPLVGRRTGRRGKVKGGRRYDMEFEIPVFLTAENLKPFWPSGLEENSKPIQALRICFT